MATPDSNSNEPSRMKKIINAGNNPLPDSIKARLPQGNGAKSVDLPPPAASKARLLQSSVTRHADAAPAPAAVAAAPPTVENTANAPRLRLLPAFWTIASIMSITVNIVMIAVVLILLRMLGGLQVTANDQMSGLLGGLYNNFVKMDQATITRVVPVDANIPLNIQVPVQATTQITVAQAVTIPNAHVRINTGALNIDADAVVTLPANTPLTVNLDFPLTVQNTIPIHLDVPVNIPLNETQLHEPFVGLQGVVKPWYCMVEPNATVSGIQVCSPIQNP